MRLISEDPKKSGLVFAGALVLLLTAAGIALHGYHYGIEDQAIYLPAIKKALNPSLYPHDAVFFVPQTRATAMTWIVAASVRRFGVTVAQAVFAWHCVSIFVFLAACWSVAARVFASTRARVGAVALETALLTLPVAGTALYLVDQYLHPRTLATGLVLFAVATVLPRVAGERISPLRLIGAAVLLASAALVHVLMAFFGAIFVLFLLVPERWFGQRSVTFAMFLPLMSFFEPGSAEWVEATRTRTQHYLLRWEWYEWLGAIGPLVILWVLARVADRKGMPLLRNLCIRTAAFGSFALLCGIAVIPRLAERLTPYQPMRMFHLVYIIFVLVAGGMLAQWVLKRAVWRWLVLFVPLCGGMYFAQRQLFVASGHVEWPGRSTRNPWVEAFDWIKVNTPQSAYFALDPHYVSYPGEDYHGFRGLAERSQLADWDKDAGVVSLFPSVAKRWHGEVHSVLDWQKFTPDDFRRLHEQFGVDWIVIANPEYTIEGYAEVIRDSNLKHWAEIVKDEDCSYHNAAVTVCKIR